MNYLCCCCRTNSETITISDYSKPSGLPDTDGTFVHRRQTNAKGSISSQPTEEPIPEEPEPIRQAVDSGRWNPSYLEDDTPKSFVTTTVVDEKHTTTQDPETGVKETECNGFSSITSGGFSFKAEVTNEPVTTVVVDDPNSTSTVVQDTEVKQKSNEIGGIASSQVIIDSPIHELKKTEVTEVTSPIIGSMSSTTVVKDSESNQKLNETTEIVSSQVIFDSSISSEITTEVTEATSPTIGSISSTTIVHDSELNEKSNEGAGNLSSQVIVESSTHSENSKPIPEVSQLPVWEVISSESTTITDDGGVKTISSQTVTGSSSKVEESNSGFHSEMTSLTSNVTLTQTVTSESFESVVSGDENKLASTIISSDSNKDSPANKDSVGSDIFSEAIECCNGIDHVVTEHLEEGEVPDEPQIEEPERVGYYDAFKNFISGLVTTPQTAETELEFFHEENQMASSLECNVNEIETDSSNPLANEVTTTITETIPTTLEENQLVSSQVVTDSNSKSEFNWPESTKPQVVELITTPKVEVVTTTSTNGNEEVKIIATKYTSDGPTFLELADSSQTMMTSTSEESSTQVTTTSMYSREEVETTSSQVLVGVIKSSKIESLETTTSEETFASSTSSVMVNSSSKSNGVYFSEYERPLSLPTGTKFGPTIIEIKESKTTPITETKTESFSSYTVSEPSN